MIRPVIRAVARVELTRAQGAFVEAQRAVTDARFALADAEDRLRPARRRHRQPPRGGRVIRAVLAALAAIWLAGAALDGARVSASLPSLEQETP